MHTFCYKTKVISLNISIVSVHLVVLMLHMSYSTLQRDRLCTQRGSVLLSDYLESLQGRVEAGLSQQDKNDLERDHNSYQILVYY